MLLVILSILLGVLFGTFTGLIPGVHINLISTIILSSYVKISGYFSNLEVAVFIISMSITHTFVDAIPSIYLGAPGESQALTALPGHKMLLKGHGHAAIKLTIIGSFFTLICCITFFGLFLKAMSLMEELTKGRIGYILLGLILFVILSQKGKILKSVTIFLLSASIGLSVLNINSLNQPLFHMLSGFFGISLLIDSLSNDTKIPEQTYSEIRIDKTAIKKSILTSSIAGFFAAFTPGFGTSQTAIIAQKFYKGTQKSFLILVGGLNTANMIVSLCSFYVLNKARNGSIVAIKEILESMIISELVLLITVSLIAGSIATISTLNISRVFSKILPKINYKKTALTVIIGIITLSLFFDGIIGLLIITTSTSLGIFATKLEVGKNNLMGCLIVPTILFLI